MSDPQGLECGSLMKSQFLVLLEGPLSPTRPRPGPTPRSQGWSRGWCQGWSQGWSPGWSPGLCLGGFPLSASALALRHTGSEAGGCEGLIVAPGPPRPTAGRIPPPAGASAPRALPAALGSYTRGPERRTGASRPQPKRGATVGQSGRNPKSSGAW